MAPGGWTPEDMYQVSIIEQRRLNRLYESQLQQSVGIGPSLGSPPPSRCAWYQKESDEGQCELGGFMLWSVLAGVGVAAVVVMKRR